MAASMTHEGAALVLTALLPEGTERYLALFEDKAAIQELADANYSRVAYGTWTQSGLQRSNTISIEWPAVAADVAVEAVGVFDAAVGGTLLWFATIAFTKFPVPLEPGDSIRLNPGELLVTLAGS